MSFQTHDVFAIRIITVSMIYWETIISVVYFVFFSPLKRAIKPPSRKEL